MLQRAASNVSDKPKNIKPKVRLAHHWCDERKKTIIKCVVLYYIMY